MQYLFFHPKLTDLARFRDEAQAVTLESACREPIVRGEQPEYEEFGDVTVLKTVDLKNGYIDYKNALRISRPFFDDNPGAQVRKGDILVTSTGYVSMAKVDVYDRDEPALVDGHVAIVRVDTNRYDPYFVAYFLRSRLSRLQFEKWFTGSSGQIEVQPAELGRFLIPKDGPDGILKEQQEIIAKSITQRLDKALRLRQQAEGEKEKAEQEFEQALIEREN